MAVTTAAALIGSAVAGVGGSLYAGNKAAGAAKSAAKQGSAVQLQMLDRQLQVGAPTMRIGYQAQRELAELYGLNPDQRLPWEGPETRYGGPGGVTIDGRTGRVVGANRPLRAGQAGGRPLGSAIRVPPPAGAEPARRTKPDGSPLKVLNPVPNATASGPVGAVAAGRPSFVPASEDPRLRNFFTSPGYNFRIGEGIKALDRGAAAKGGLYSGAQMKGITRFGQGIASDEYARWLGGLQSLAGQGISAGNQYGAAAGQTGADLARIYGNSAYARGSAYGDAAGGVNDAIQGGIGNWIYARERGLV